MIRKLLLAFTLCLPLMANAKEAVSVIADPELHERVMSVSRELRCLVCQGQSLADSHAEFAVDMRVQIEEMMRDGMSDREVVDFMVQRYGDTIRYRPPVNAVTWLLWFAPGILLVCGVGILFFNIYRHEEKIGDESLSDEDRRQAESLLEEDAGDRK